MKKIILSLLLLFCCYLVHGQEIIGSVDYDHFGGYSGSTKKIIRLDDQSFILVKEKNAKESEIIKYNQQLEELFKITVESTSFSPDVGYVEKANAIVVIVKEKEGRKDYTITASLYNADNGAFIKNKLLMEGSVGGGTPQFSLNGSCFYIANRPKDLLKEPIAINLFSSSSLESLGTVNYQFQWQEELFCLNLSNQADLLLGVTAPYKESIEFMLFGKNGSLKKSIVKKAKFKGREFYEDVIYKEPSPGKGKLILSREKGKALKGLEVWEVDYDNLAINTLFTADFDKVFIKEKINKNVYLPFSAESDQRHLLALSRRRPNKLKHYSLKDVLMDEQGDIVAILEQLTSKEAGSGSASGSSVYYYKAENILLMAFDQTGSYKWSNLIERKAHNKSGWSHSKKESDFKPKWSGLKSVAYKADGELRLVNWEIGGWTSCYVAIRKIDWHTGKMLFVQPLLSDENVHINTNYISWLNNKQIALLNMKGVGSAFSKNEIKLQVVEINR